MKRHLRFILVRGNLTEGRLLLLPQEENGKQTFHLTAPIFVAVAK